MNLFGSQFDLLDAADVRIIWAFLATIGLLQERTIRSGEIVSEQLQGALNSRVTIEQAKGALARVDDTVDAPSKLMRASAGTTCGPATSPRRSSPTPPSTPS